MAPEFAPMALFQRANGSMPPRDWLCFAVFRNGNVCYKTYPESYQKLIIQFS